LAATADPTDEINTKESLTTSNIDLEVWKLAAAEKIGVTNKTSFLNALK
jgi:hypothetical protein